MDLQAKLSGLCEALGVPGAVAGVVRDGRLETAFHGVTNVDHPLAVEENTLFQFGSTGKTVTATAILVLVEQGKVDLDAPVRTYVPELRLQDEQAAAEVTVLQLLNHTAGWSGDLILETGDGDDCLEKYLFAMADLEQVSPLGASVSYNNASLCLAGLVIQRVTGTTYEQAVRDLVLTPLGLDRTYGSAKEIMTFRFASGHENHDDGTVETVRPWALPRSGCPAGGWTATIGDQLRWAQFHLGHVGDDVLPKDVRKRMHQPTALMPGSALGDAVGISWLLSSVDDTLLVGHGGTTHGQHSDFVMVPERDYAFVCMTNSSNGPQAFKALREWAFENHLGLVEAEPEYAELEPEVLGSYAGLYSSSVADITLVTEGTGLVAQIVITDPTVMTEGQDPRQPDIPLALVVGDGDRYVVSGGPAKGMKGYFSRGDDGTVDGINLGGRHNSRVVSGV